jgi:hypothetical protein
MPSWRVEEAKMENGGSDPVNGMENFQQVKPLDFMSK